MTEQRTYQRAQLRFQMGAPTLDAEQARAAVAEPLKAQNVRIRGVANTGAVMPSMFGQVALNLAGMRLRQPLEQRALPLMFEHDEPIGYVTSVALDPVAGLVFEAQVIPAVEAATNALALAAGGFPWQCSLYAEPTKVREVQQGETFSVNGRDFAGPGDVFEEWWLGEVTITAQGRDPMTSAGLAASREGAEVRLSVEVSKTMADATKAPPAVDGGNAGATPAMTLDELRAKFPALVAEIEKAAFQAGVVKGQEIQQEIDSEIATAAHETMAGGEADPAKQPAEAQVAAVAASAIKERKSVKDVFPRFLQLGRAIASRGAATAADPRAARAAVTKQDEPLPDTAKKVDDDAAKFAALSPEEQARWGRADYFAAYNRAVARGSVNGRWRPPVTAAAGGSGNG